MDGITLCMNKIAEYVGKQDDYTNDVNLAQMQVNQAAELEPGDDKVAAETAAMKQLTRAQTLLRLAQTWLKWFQDRLGEIIQTLKSFGEMGKN